MDSNSILQFHFSCAYPGLGASGYFGITALGKRFFMKDKLAYSQWLETLASKVSPLQVICIAHGEPITANCHQRLREAAARLY